jgi:hypothetical protein
MRLALVVEKLTNYWKINLLGTSGKKLYDHFRAFQTVIR